MKSFFMNGSDTVLPTAPSRALRTLAQGAVTSWGTQPREPSSPAGETGVSAVAVLATGSPKWQVAPSRQPLLDAVVS